MYQIELKYSFSMFYCNIFMGYPCFSFSFFYFILLQMSHFFEFVSSSLDGSVPINNYVIQKQIISMEKLNNFETFIRLNESSTQRESAISMAVSKLKARYGDTLEKFLKNVK